MMMKAFAFTAVLSFASVPATQAAPELSDTYSSPPVDAKGYRADLHYGRQTAPDIIQLNAADEQLGPVYIDRTTKVALSLGQAYVAMGASSGISNEAANRQITGAHSHSVSGSIELALYSASFSLPPNLFIELVSSLHLLSTGPLELGGQLNKVEITKRNATLASTSNTWISSGSNFDGVIGCEVGTRDPIHPTRLFKIP